MPAEGLDETLSSPAARIRAYLEDWLGPGAAARTTHADDPLAEASPLYPDEQAAIGRVHPRRLADFRLGRAAARQALRAVGIESSIPRASDGAPVWPAGLVGSLSHCGALACAAVAPVARFRSIGLDLESVVGLTPDIVERVCRPDERAHHRGLPAIEGANWDILTFSAKEAFYKCWRPVTGRFLDFAELSLRFTPTGPGAGRFSIQEIAAAEPGPPGALEVEGRWFVDSGLVATAALWRAPALQYASYNSVADSDGLRSPVSRHPGRGDEPAPRRVRSPVN